MNILAVGAHPDDLEFLCAGTLARYAAAGHRVFMAHLCSGNKGGREIDPAELAAVRDREATAAAAVIGAETLGPVAADLDLYDHVNTSRLVFDAAFTATLPLHRSGRPAHEAIVPIYYLDTMSGVGFAPEEYVDITGFFETKKRMLLAHESQYKWVQGHHLTDPLRLLEITGRYRGLQCGVEYAEAFRAARVWGRLRPERLLP
ncbi:MAG: Mycothiol S-conjugate amidase [candidate division TA06 bacterium ADurb.Bin417]|uniref:Mycothiol S-conjugate amidase n=1 Tax=candidate division TA06 bacterium ADurb.Bin417 TaxID=1852828 RepID=A0A1V5MGW1_UNCT6|nr:MAG: Mycothiol S-conjugate amidase [candidate division TA06 bacterium ADurb.Bin417]